VARNRPFQCDDIILCVNFRDNQIFYGNAVASHASGHFAALNGVLGETLPDGPDGAGFVLGAVGGIPLTGFAFGCAANADAILAAPQQFTYFQGGGFDCSLLSFMEVDAGGNVNVSRLSAKPHVTAGCGGFVDITSHARKLVFVGYFTAGGLQLDVSDGKLQVLKEGKFPKFVKDVEHVTFSGRMAKLRGQDVTYITERCVLKLVDGHLTVTEIAPGIDLKNDVLDRSMVDLRVSDQLKEMDRACFEK